MSASTEFIVAIDGGGSKVSAAAIPIRDALLQWPTVSADCAYKTSIEGTGSAAESTWRHASQHIFTSVESLCDKIGCRTANLKLLVLALSGAGRPTDRNRVLQWTANHSQLSMISQIEVVGDIDPIAQFQSNAQTSQPSVAVIVGTGSIIASQLPGQPLIRAGGWGPILGDEGSGWAIARDALRAVCSWLDNDACHDSADALIRFVVEQLAECELRSVNSVGYRQLLSEAILSLANDRKQAAKLTPGILRLAFSSTDSPAARIVDKQIESLAALVRAVHTRARLSQDAWNLVLSGGLICNHPHYQAKLLCACARHDLRPSQTIQVDPLVAALQFAAKITRQKRS